MFNKKEEIKMRINKAKKFLGLFSLFMLTMVYPLFGNFLDIKFSLEGVKEEINKPKLSLSAMMDGSYQNGMEKFLSENIPGKGFMVRAHNQLLYTVFNESSNSNVIIGKDKQLFEPEYLDYSLNIKEQPTENEIQILVDKLEKLQTVLEEDNKQLYIFITPSKVRYFSEYAPEYYKECAKNENGELAYDKFIRMTKDTKLNIFDSVAFIDTHKESFKFPLWYRTGIHWSIALGSNVAEAFNKYLIQQSGYDLGQIHVTNQIVSECLHPDADLYKILNLLLPSSEEYYNVEIEVEEGKDKPNVFLRGGSFMGQSLRFLITSNIFNKDIHFENNYYFTDLYSNKFYLSNFNAYNEIDVESYLKQSDIMILEVNEEKIYTMGWGFIDYVLENYVPEAR